MALIDATKRLVGLAAAEGALDNFPGGFQRSAVIGTVFIFGEGNDVDILVETDGKLDLDEVCQELMSRDWEINGGSGYEVNGDWFSAREGDRNLIITDCCHFYNAMLGGATVCKMLAERGKLDRQDRDTRVLIHRTLIKVNA